MRNRRKNSLTPSIWIATTLAIFVLFTASATANRGRVVDWVICSAVLPVNSVRAVADSVICLVLHWVVANEAVLKVAVAWVIY